MAVFLSARFKVSGRLRIPWCRSTRNEVDDEQDEKCNTLRSREVVSTYCRRLGRGVTWWDSVLGGVGCVDATASTNRSNDAPQGGKASSSSLAVASHLSKESKAIVMIPATGGSCFTACVWKFAHLKFYICRTEVKSGISGRKVARIWSWFFSLILFQMLTGPGITIFGIIACNCSLLYKYLYITSFHIISSKNKSWW